MTEVFSELLRVLIERDFDAFALVFERLSGLDYSSTDQRSFIVSTQVATDAGYPDLRIQAPGVRVLVEVKDTSPVSSDQLERYLAVLSSSPEPAKQLVFLTRHSVTPPGFDRRVRAVSWIQVGESIAMARVNSAVDPVADYFMEQFLAFLEDKGMAINKVEWGLNDGLQQFMNLKALLRDALEEAGAHRVWAAYGADFNGVAVPDPGSNNSAYFWFVEFDNPGRLLFTTYNENVKPEFAGRWESHSNKSVKKVLDLGSEEIHFFARSVSSQSTLLRDFVRSCLEETIYDPDLADS